MSKSLLILIIILYSNISFACSCAGLSSFEKEYDSVELVAIGLIKSIEFEGAESTATLVLNNTWKGTSKKIVNINGGTGRGPCGFPFEKDQEYLVFAHKTPWYHRVLGHSEFTASFCSATLPLNHYAVDSLLEWLAHNKPFKQDK